MSTTSVTTRESHKRYLLSERYKSITTLKELQSATQGAINVEMATIPLYLNALYSIMDRSSEAFQALRSVVMEEMFRVNQAANILIGIGGTPQFTGDVVPKYPSYLPGANPNTTPYLGLFQASQTVFSDVFMAVERPAAFEAPPEGANFDTIGQYYAGLWLGIEACVKAYGHDTVFRQEPGRHQLLNIYLGKFGGKPIDVTSEITAKQAINEIVRQGEGAVTESGQLVPVQPYGAYQHYGQRTDGTYGPIMGVPLEMSHYIKFQKIANAPDFPSTYPIVSNGQLSDYTNLVAIDCAIAFNKVYSLMLRTLELSFKEEGFSSQLYFRFTLPLMHEYMPNLAWVLMQVPVMPDGSGDVGPNASPLWLWDPDSSVDQTLAALEKAAASAATAGLVISLPRGARVPSAAPASPAVIVGSATPTAPSTVQERLNDVVVGLRRLTTLIDLSHLGL